MDIPTHKVFKMVMYYDVLLCLCRHACQQDFYKNEIAKAKEQIKVMAKIRGQQLTENQLRQNAHNIAMANAGCKFQNIMKKLDDRDDEQIELIEELRTYGAKIGKKHMQLVDDWKHTLEGQAGIYTTKHYIYGKRLLKVWREKKTRRQKQKACFKKLFLTAIEKKGNLILANELQRL